jgi:hypothetical protein
VLEIDVEVVVETLVDVETKNSLAFLKKFRYFKTKHFLKSPKL